MRDCLQVGAKQRILALLKLDRRCRRIEGEMVACYDPRRAAKAATLSTVSGVKSIT